VPLLLAPAPAPIHPIQFALPNWAKRTTLPLIPDWPAEPLDQPFPCFPICPPMIGYKLVLRRFDDNGTRLCFRGVYVIRSCGGHDRETRKRLIQRLRRLCMRYRRQGGPFGPIFQGKLYWVNGNRKWEIDMFVEAMAYITPN
jgi:hypothetical protein